MSHQTSPIEVGYDPKSGAYLANVSFEGDAVAAETDWQRLRKAIKGLIATGKLTRANYDIGQGGAIAFKLGNWRIGWGEADSVTEVCAILEQALAGECTTG